LDALFDFLIDDPYAGVAVFGMSQPDVTLALQQPWVAIDNDSSGTSPEGILGQAAKANSCFRMPVIPTIQTNKLSEDGKARIVKHRSPTREQSLPRFGPQ
jgi:hypothetical protein